MKFDSFYSQSSVKQQFAGWHNFTFFVVFALVVVFSATPSFSQVSTFPYTESWEGGSTGSWTQSTGDDFDWTNNTGGTGSSSTGPSGANDGTRYLYTETSSPVNNFDIAILENSFDLSSLSVPRLTFDYHMYFAGSPNGGRLDVDVSTNGGSTWTNEFTRSGDQGQVWNSATVDLSSYAGQTVDLRFHFTVGSNTAYENDCAIDDLVLEETPSCLAPTNLATANITTTGVDLSWTASATTVNNGYDWEIVPAGNGQGNGVVSSGNVSGTSVTASGLSSNTDYDAFVRANCGGGNGQSAYAGPVSFTTDCNAFSTPYVEDFEAFATTNRFTNGECWTGLGAGANDIEIVKNPDFDPSVSPFGSIAVELNDGEIDDNDTSAFVSPALAGLSAADKRIRFQAVAEGTDNILYIGVLDNDNDLSTLNIIDSVVFSTADVWEEIIINLTNSAALASAQHIALLHGPSGYEIGIDSLVYKDLPPCAAPTNLTTSNPTLSSVDLGWTASPTTVNNGYDWEIVPAGNGQGNGVVASGNVSGTSVTASGLSVNTQYDAFVRANCGGGNGQSAYIGPVRFTTSSRTLYYVDANNGDDNNTGDSGDPYKTFDKAYSQASAGDTIDLTGTFDWTDANETGDNQYEGYNISKDLTIRGQGPGNTYIQAASSKGAADRRIFQIDNNVSVTFKDLTLRYGQSAVPTGPNGFPEPYKGGAIGSGNYVTPGYYKGVDITLKNVSVKDNGGNNSYGEETVAIYTEGSISAEDCTFEGNKLVSSESAHVIELFDNSNNPTREFINCTFHDNRAGQNESILYLDRTGANIVNCTFSDNICGDATIEIYDNSGSSEETFIYNTVVANTILNSGGSGQGNDVYVNGGSSGGLKAKYSVIEDLNDPNNYVNSTNLTTGNQSQLYLANSTTTNGNNNSTPFLKYTSSGSILLNAGNSSSSVGNTYSGGTVSTPSKDQRGVSHKNTIDIGAYERLLFQPSSNVNALEFYGRGSDEYVKVKDDPSLDVSSITVEAWVKLNCSNNTPGCGNDGYGRIAVKHDGSTTNADYVSNSVFFLGFDGNGKTPRFAIQTSSGVTDFTAPNAINKSEWYHVAGTYSSSTGKAKIYVNGEAVASKNVSANNLVTSSKPVTLGASKVASKTHTTYGLDGELDEVRIWSEARTASEIRQYMNRCLKGDNTNLEAYYRFNQTSGTSVPDLSNNTNAGTLKNMTTSGSGNDWVGSNAFTTWQGDESSNWSTSGNWTDGVPSSGDNVGIVSNSNFNEPSVSGSPTVDNLTIGPNASPTVNSDITVNNHLMLENKLDMAGNTLTLADGSDVFPQGGASGQYISGTVKKKGDEAFTFPLGDGGQWARIKISAPSNTSDAFTASYTNSSYSNTTTGSNLNNVSAVEYWDLDRTNGSSSVDVTLYWEDGSQSGSNITKLSDLVVAHWNASKTEWESLGQNSTSGSTSSGSITVNGVSNFSPFTFGSTSSNNNPLPVELLHFTAQKANAHVDLKWATASETNNRHFVVQKRIDDQWQQIGTVEGQGTATSKHSYTFEDREYQQGNTAYYRLKQVDFDGSYEYSEVRAVSSELEEALSMTTYPNPVADELTLSLNSFQAKRATVVIRNVVGQQMLSRELSLQQGKNRQTLNLESLKTGQYFLKVKTDDKVYHQKVIKE